MKTDRSDKTSSFFLGFALLLLIGMFIVLLIFVNIQPKEQIWTLGVSPKTEWSQTSDFLSAVIGIPTALAGSIVAILLAHKAYSVSRQQSRFEAQVYLETAATHLAETYWTLSGAMRRIDEAHDAMLADMTRKPANKDEKAEGLSRELVDEEFRIAVKELSQALLAIHKDPLAFEAWRAIDHAKIKERVESARSTALQSFTTGEFRPLFNVSDTMDLAAISQALTTKVRQIGTRYGLLKSFYILLWQRRAFGNRKLCADGRYRSEKEIAVGEEGLDFQSRIFSAQPEASIFDVRDLAEDIGSRTALMGERLSATFGPSVFGDTAGGVPSGLLMREGGFMLAAIFLAWPTEKQLEQVVLKFMSDRKMNSIDREVASRIIKDKNIPAYIPVSMRDDALAFLSDASLAVAPSPHPFHGY